MHLKKILFFAGLLLALAGCNTIDRRISEKQDVFNRLDLQTQAKVRQGTISIGYTPDMVYIALGPPSAKQQKAIAEGDESIWIYKAYYRKYEGTAFAGYQSMMISDPSGRGGRSMISLVPVKAPVYSEQEEDKIRVHFVNGKVSAIDKLRG
jgi:hypothetical protein